MKKQRIGYKVVRQSTDEPPQLMSVYAWKNPLTRVVYPPGEWVAANEKLASMGWHLLAFDSKEAALHFLHNSSPFQGGVVQVWSCELQGVRRPARFRWTDLFIRADLDFFTQRLAVGSRARTYNPWPYGSLMVQRLKLMERVL